MRITKVISLLSSILVLGGISSAFAHEEDSRVAIELESPASITAGKVNVEFQLVDTKENRVLTPDNLNLSHEKRLHFLAYDPALKEFQHVHPEFDGKIWNVQMEFSVDGNYFVWAQGELASDGAEFSGLTRLVVTGGKARWPTPPVLNDNRSGSADISKVTISNSKLRAGNMAMLDMKFTRNNGTQSKITPYLGALAHVVAVPEDGDSLIHVHPMNGSKPNEGMLHVTFPAAGFYRMWVQFVDDGILKVVPLSVQVF